MHCLVTVVINNKQDTVNVELVHKKLTIFSRNLHLSLTLKYMYIVQNSILLYSPQVL